VSLWDTKAQNRLGWDQCS